MSGERELYRSPNGDCWFLARETETDHAIIIHRSNTPSGGHISRIDLGTFLSRGAMGPEHQALLRLLGKLATVPSAGPPFPRDCETGISQKPLEPPEQMAVSEVSDFSRNHPPSMAPERAWLIAHSYKTLADSLTKARYLSAARKAEQDERWWTAYAAALVTDIPP